MLAHLIYSHDVLRDSTFLGVRDDRSTVNSPPFHLLSGASCLQISVERCLTLSESLLVSSSDRLFDLTVSETVPSSSSATNRRHPPRLVSRFMSNAFEYGDALLPQETDPDTGESLIPAQIGSNQPYLNLATYVFCMCPLNDHLMTI